MLSAVSSDDAPQRGTSLSMPTNPLIALVAGEASGDQLGGALIPELLKIYPGARFAGIGGPLMKAQGMEIWWQSEELAVMGLAEVVSHLPRLLQLRKNLRNRLLSERPDIFIGIDAPDFNLGLEKQLRHASIPTVHYVSPSVWAWRQGRVKSIGKCADLVLCLFPFEPALYKAHGVDAEYTGHPMADEISNNNDFDTDKHDARVQLGFEPTKPCIAILPGSRVSEVERLSSHLLAAASLLVKQYPGLQFVAPMASEKAATAFRTALQNQPDLDCRLIEGQARLAMKAADVVLCASGTAALETMLVNRPMVVVYRLSGLSYAIVKTLKLVKSEFFSLPNVLAGEKLVPELGQHQVTAIRIAREAAAWLDDSERCASVSFRFSELHQQLRKNAAASAANAIRSLLDKRQ
ncbi:MAG: lipid-A-disaccharide synthase [Rhodothermales bacterium]|jgi:lipid-A-disaccharide synthase